MKTEQQFELVYKALKENILQGKCPHNHHLVVNDLVNEFGVGKSVVSHVLQELEKDKLAVSIPQKGSFVNCPHHYKELLGLRNDLEISAMRQVVERISEEGLEYLCALADTVEQVRKQNDLAQFVGAELGFHRYLVECSKNNYLIMLYNNLQDHLKQYFSNYGSRLFSVYERYEDVSVLMDHRLITNAIRLAQRRNDVDIAIQILKIHLTPSKGVLLTIEEF